MSTFLLKLFKAAHLGDAKLLEGEHDHLLRAGRFVDEQVLGGLVRLVDLQTVLWDRVLVLVNATVIVIEGCPQGFGSGSALIHMFLPSPDPDPGKKKRKGMNKS